MEVEINLEEINDNFERLKSHFGQYHGFNVKLVVDTTIQDYYGEWYLNQKFVLTYDRKNSPITIEILIHSSGELCHNPYGDVLHLWCGKKAWDFAEIWKALFFGAI